MNYGENRKRNRRLLLCTAVAVAGLNVGVDPFCGAVQGADLKVGNPQIKASPHGSFRLKISGDPGTYDLYASTDSRTWLYMGRTKILAGQDAAIFEDTEATHFQYRFYQLKQVDPGNPEPLKDLPVVGIQVARSMATERGQVPAIFFVSREGETSGPLTVQLQAGGSAQAGVDYTNFPGTITIPPNQKNLKVYLYPIDDDLAETDETIRLSIVDREYYEKSEASSAIAYILDDDRQNQNGSVQVTDQGTGETPLDRGGRGGAPTALVQLSISQTKVNEGASEVIALTISREGGTGGELPVTLNVGGNAIPGKHFGKLPSRVSFSLDNDALTIPVFVIDDSVVEPDRQLNIQVAPGSGYEVRNPSGVQLLIADNDAIPVVLPQLEVAAGPDMSTIVNQWATLQGEVRIDGSPWTAPVDPLIVSRPVADAGLDQNTKLNQWLQLEGRITIVTGPIQTAQVHPSTGPSTSSLL